MDACLPSDIFSVEPRWGLSYTVCLFLALLSAFLFMLLRGLLMGLLRGLLMGLKMEFDLLIESSWRCMYGSNGVKVIGSSPAAARAF